MRSPRVLSSSSIVSFFFASLLTGRNHQRIFLSPKTSAILRKALLRQWLRSSCPSLRSIFCSRSISIAKSNEGRRSYNLSMWDTFLQISRSW